ncbi:MAG: hypothetical protein E6Q97_27430 [Desulfurellales bacterium]|nr:MAG: hypothetical protein E6Q97_27430 [Desulfurellales bacterium]
MAAPNKAAWQGFERSVEAFLKNNDIAARRTAPMGYQGTDIIIDGRVPAIADCKYASGMRLNPWRLQVEQDAVAMENEDGIFRIPVVIHRRAGYNPTKNCGTQWVTMTLQDFVDLLR